MAQSLTLERHVYKLVAHSLSGTLTQTEEQKAVSRNSTVRLRPPRCAATPLDHVPQLLGGQLSHSRFQLHHAFHFATVDEKGPHA